MSSTEHDPVPASIRRLLTRGSDHWYGRGGLIHVVPPGRRPSRAFPSSEDPALMLGEQQEVRLTWPTGEVRFGEDDVGILPAHRPHNYAFDPHRRRFPVLTISPFGDDLWLLRVNRPQERWPEAGLRLAAGTGDILRRSLELVVELVERPEGDPAWAAATARALIAGVLGQALDALDRPVRPSRGGPPVAVRCRELLRARLDDPALDMAAIAGALDYDADWLSREYRRQTGTTVRQTLIQLRVQRARELLRRRELPIAEVARRCGFASASHFSRTFARVEGNPPRKFRTYGHLEGSDP